MFSVVNVWPGFARSRNRTYCIVTLSFPFGLPFRTQIFMVGSPAFRLGGEGVKGDGGTDLPYHLQPELLTKKTARAFGGPGIFHEVLQESFNLPDQDFRMTDRGFCLGF
jgi:hypothetical protein